jgi:hypothetical protein
MYPKICTLEHVTPLGFTRFRDSFLAETCHGRVTSNARNTLYRCSTKQPRALPASRCDWSTCFAACEAS